MSKRVYEIARELSMGTKEVIERLNDAGVEVTNHFAVVEDTVYERVFGDRGVGSDYSPPPPPTMKGSGGVEEKRSMPHSSEHNADINPVSRELVEELRDQVAYLREQLEWEREANRENRRLLATALGRIPPQLEASSTVPSTAPESPAAPPQKPLGAPSSATSEEEKPPTEDEDRIVSDSVPIESEGAPPLVRDLLSGRARLQPLRGDTPRKVARVGPQAREASEAEATTRAIDEGASEPATSEPTPDEERRRWSQRKFQPLATAIVLGVGMALTLVHAFLGLGGA